MGFKKNMELVKIFMEMSNIYKYKGAEERFRCLAYLKASKMLASLPKNISTYLQNDTLEGLSGIGEGMAGKIKEYIRTGKIKKFEELKKGVPFELLDMMDITGFGTQSLKNIHEKLHISTKEEIIEALHNGSIAKIKGFGKTKVNKMLVGLKIHKTIEERLLLWDALEVGETVLNWLRQIPEIHNAELAGSLRRRKETIGDIDILVSCDERARKIVVKHFADTDFAGQVLVKGDTMVSIILKENGRQVDLRIVNEDEWGSALLYFTGSKEHSVHLRTIAKEKGFKISEYGIFSIKTGKRIASKTEKDIYSTLGFQYIPPELREDKGEIELGQKHKLPELINENDIAGDMQMHSIYSDGLNTMEAIVHHVRKNYDYKYIVITDHSRSSRIAHGMDKKRVLQQLHEIRSINKELDEDYVKAGIEVDILPDGGLDFSDELLAEFDWVTASIHSRFNIDNTDRIIKACENPFVNCIGHPTGRLIGKRESYQIDFEKVMETAKYTNTALEINAQPDRMDLNEILAKFAVERGVMLSISTDSHALKNFEFMKLGVSIARRAWCKKGDVLNTRSWEEINKFKLLKFEKKLKHEY